MRRFLAAHATALLACSLAIAIAGCRDREPPASMMTSTDLVNLARTVTSETKQFRRTAARISGVSEYKPPPPRARKAQEAKAALSAKGASTASQVLAYRGTVDPEAHHSFAITMLAMNEIEPAVREIAAALQLGSMDSVETTIDTTYDAALLVDASAVHYSRYEQRREASDLLIALAAALRAHELAPHSTDALWNRALLLDELGLVAEARQAWDNYLTVDGQSAWATEARERRERLPGKSIATRDSSREATLLIAQKTADPKVIRSEAALDATGLNLTIERVWIPAWAAAVLANDPSAPSRLRAIAVGGEAIRERTADQLISSFATSATATARFAGPHARLATIRAILQQRGTEAALEISVAVLRDLREIRSPMASSVAVGIASLQYHDGRYREALKSLEAVDAELRAAGSPLTEARAAWVRAVSLTSLGAVGPATAFYQRSLQLFGAVGDVSQVAPLNMLQADNAELAGEFDEMWSRYLVAVREGERHSSDDRVQLILSTFCRAALRQGRARIAELLNDALLRRATTPEALPFRAQGLITRCDLLARRQQFAAARTQCEAARQAWALVTDPSARKRLEADLEAATAAADQFENTDVLSRAVEVSVERRDLYRLSRLLLLRGRVYLKQGAIALAETDFERSLQAIEEQRQRLDAVNDKMAYFETSRAVAEDLIQLLVSQRRYDDALEVVERVRARSLVDRMSAAASQEPVALRDILRAIPRAETLVVYWCAPTETYIWVLNKGRVQFHRKSVSQAEIAGATRQLVTGLFTNETLTASDDSDFLYDVLIAPLADDLAGTDTITFVPDLAFAGAPYSALRNRNTGRYVVHDYAITRAASATSYTLRPPQAPYRSLLMLMNPRTDNLPSLNVDSEIRAAESAIPRAAVFTRDTATESVLSDLIRNYAVVHIAAHGTEDAFGEPALALASDSTRDGKLTTSEVEALPLQPGALVVLASCGSASGRQTGEGVLSLARAFMSAGTRSVVAALWDADDQDSGRLLAVFYDALKSGRPVAQALRLAQLESLRNPRFSNPRHWAAYQIEGGS